MSGQDLFYPGTWIMKNKLGIRNKDELENVEKTLSTLKAFSLPEKTKGLGFGLERLKSIHKHLFEDLYDWAGEERDFAAKKYSNSQTFTDPSKFEEVFSDIESDLLESGWFNDDYTVSQAEFASKISDIYTKVNAAHPFPEGNGRATREYLKAIGAEVGFNIDFSMTNSSKWYEASKKSFEGNQGPLKIIFKEISRENSMGVTAEMNLEDARKDKKFLSMFNINLDSEIPDFTNQKNSESDIIKRSKDQSKSKNVKPDSPHP